MSDDARIRELESTVREFTARAESAELGCKIAYLREPTQMEGDAHEQGYGSGECFVPMGGHKGHRCSCGRWTWKLRTTCDRCIASGAVLTTNAKLDRIRALLVRNGCDCDCEHHWEDHDADCERCLACQIGETVK